LEDIAGVAPEYPVAWSAAKALDGDQEFRWLAALVTVRRSVWYTLRRIGHNNSIGTVGHQAKAKSRPYFRRAALSIRRLAILRGVRRVGAGGRNSDALAFRGDWFLRFDKLQNGPDLRGSCRPGPLGTRGGQRAGNPSLDGAYRCKGLWRGCGSFGT
jgi:hypothetical protein